MSWWLWGGYEHEVQEPLRDALDAAADTYQAQRRAERLYTPEDPAGVSSLEDAIHAALAEGELGGDLRYEVLVDAPEGDGLPGAPLGPSIAVVDGGTYAAVDAAAYLDLEQGTLYEAYRDVAAFRTEDWTDGSRLRESVRAEAAEGAPVTRDWRYTATAAAARVAAGDDAAAVYAPDTAFAPRDPSEAERAAAYLLVTEAGGAVTCARGNDLAPQPLTADGELVAARDPETAAAVADEEELSTSYFTWGADV